MSEVEYLRKNWALRMGDDPKKAALLERIIERYSHPNRIYHGLSHLSRCYRGLDEFISHNPDALSPRDCLALYLAIAGHDSDMEQKTDVENVLKSAQFIMREALDAGIDGPVAARAYDIVLVTNHKTEPRNFLEELMLDLDLLIFGCPVPEFEEYDSRIRLEYWFVEEKTYRSRRAEVLQSFYERNPIYRTAYFRQGCEAQAKENLKRKIAQLRAF